MIEIHPAILAHSEQEFIKKLAGVRTLDAPLHIDVMDGVFVNNTTWAPPERMKELLMGAAFEAHLMVSNPEKVIPAWFAAGARRVIFHAEAGTHDTRICRAPAEQCTKLSVAINPDTQLIDIAEEIETIPHVCMMGVTPGWGGRTFEGTVLEKITTMKTLHPSIVITVDGGVKPENARMLIDAGAEILVVGSAITDTDDPAAAYQSFKEALT